jgi:hypothetical protein
MKFMAQFRLKPGAKNQAVEVFEQRGPNRNPGVRFLGAWVGNHADVAFVLVDAEDEACAAKAAEAWAAFGEAQICQVIEIQQY